MSLRTSPQQLQRELGVVGATVMGLGSIIGTGVFVSIGIAAGIAGNAVVLAVVVGALVATCNGLNSAQLAASHPVSGGSYEYGYRYLNSWLGFTAGWMFLLAKTASAATAALGFAGYLLNAMGLRGSSLLIPLALASVVILTGIVLSGIRRSNVANILIVSVSVLSLIFFIGAGTPFVLASGAEHFTPFFKSSIGSVFHASALMFVAYTGYGRIATLGEEAKEPRKTIPKAIIITMILTMLLYVVVAVVAVGSVGAEVLGESVSLGQAAPLEVVVRRLGVLGGSQILAVGAIAAMLGVLLNLILGLSRVLLAMGRRHDMPRIFALVNESQTTPVPATIAIGIAIAVLVLIGNVKTTWSFSAFTVLIYYAITNLAAFCLPPNERLYPKWVSLVGLLACLFLAFWVEPFIWHLGLALIAAGLIWHIVANKLVNE
ncbi:APC family permease [Aetokthonos hydrillicola Thurmond2011]|uniref:APC family permease n=2 Tax=Aetokthonos TaxID=1550243 RepID=A0AAP5MBC4_9CYAN|nr:APC family permease [Aetokthonos hydrillicola]MBO3458849.1 amino acid permease [Aetokthonos hydrillicola CCALA 1050]MBW4587303.1 APC family permease [Aetokthonos hydrillicola CCALA 1050]MDR9896674.1 APC family permease [Aetokthonos hydrillicola Thurmond2011]